MFYLIYLLSSLIFLCNYAYSNEDVNKITWICGNDKCDVAISDIVTTNNLKVSDHKNKLTYVSGEKGRIFKKPLDGTDYWYAEINGKQGYVHKNFVRENSINIPKPEYKVEEDNPFAQVYSNNKDGTINPSHPTVIDGTTIDTHFSEFESNPSLPPSPNNDVTPPLISNNLNENFKNSIKSAQPDSVDIDASVKSDESEGYNNTDFNNSSLGEAYSIKDSANLDGQAGFIRQDANINPTYFDTLGSDSVSSNAGYLGKGTSEPVDNYDGTDEEEDEEEEEEEYDETEETTEDLESVPSQSMSTNTNLGEQANFNIDNSKTVAANSVNGNPAQSEQFLDNIENSAKLVNNDSLNEQKQVLPPLEDFIPDNNETVLSVEQEPSGNVITDSAASLQSPGNVITDSEASLQSTGNVITDSEASLQSTGNVITDSDSSLQSTGNVKTDSEASLQSTGKSTTTADFYSQPRVPSLPPTMMHSSQLTSEFTNSVEGQQGDETNPTTLPHNLPHESFKQKTDDEIQKPTADGHAPDPYNSAKFTSNDATLDQPSYQENIRTVLIDSSVGSTDTSFNIKQSSHDSKVDSYSDSSISSTEEFSHTSKDSMFSDSSNIVSHKSEKNAVPDNTNNISLLTPSDNNSQVESEKEISDSHPKEVSEKAEYVDNVQFDTATDQIVRPIDKTKSTSDESRDQLSVLPNGSTDQPIISLAGSSDEAVSTNKNDDIHGQFSTHSYNTLSKEESDKFPPNIEELITQSPPVYESQSDSYPYTTLSPDLRKDNVQKSDDSTDVPLMAETITEEDSSNFYSSVSSFFGYFKDLFRKSELPSELKDSSTVEDIKQSEINIKPPSAPLGYCYEGESCSGLERPIGGEDQPESFYKHYKNVDLFKEAVPLSYNSILYICITSVVILLFSLGYYYIDKRQNSSYLIDKVNKLSQELFLTKKERDTLEDQLLKIKENCNIMDSSKMKQDSKLTTMQSALEESERAREQLDETVVRLEKEVETLMDQGMEMHKLLSETLSDEERSQMLLANIDELRESLSEKLNEIVTLTNHLDKKNEEIQLLQIDVRTANDRISEQDRRLESCKTETEETFTKKLHDHQQQIIKLQQVMEEKGVTIAKLENELAKTKVERDSAESRASSAEAGLQAAHSVGAGEARKAWLDSTSIRAALATANKTNETLQQSISATNTNNKLLQERINSLTEEISSLNSKYENVEKEKVNALTKLQVLSDYFKEKESKLQEELGVKESQWLQKETEDHTIYEQMKSLREEISSYKSQNDKLKAEILEQEASYKVQIANEEQKSYDNWVALRQAERKVKELQMESAHFRNRLTQLETANQSITDGLNPNGLDKGSFSAPSPPFMMLPPLPSSDFFPLPPPPIHPSASRPPPLGRISSPQLSGEMLPPPPLVSFDMLPPTTTPPPSLPMYKPQPRERPPPKDSPPSNYSSESINEKSARRRRR